MVLLAIIVLLLMVHVLRALNLLCLVELHVVLTSGSPAVLIVRLQVIVVVARVFSALRSLIVDDVKIAALLTVWY